MRVWAGVFAGFVCLLAVGVARAQDAGGGQAAELKKRGDAAMDSLHYDEALSAYAEAYALSKDPALLYNRGRVYQARADYPAALAEFEAFAKVASPGLRARVPKLTQLLDEMRGKVARLWLRTDVSGARIVVRDRVLGTTPLTAPVALNAGEAAVEVLADGYAPYRQVVTLPGGETTELTVALTPKSPAGAAAAPLPGPKPVEGAASGPSLTESGTGPSRDAHDAEPKPVPARWWFWAGVGAVVVGSAVVTVALLTEKSPGTGDAFAPGQVRGPLVRW
jgi:hypothetical protein